MGLVAVVRVGVLVECCTMWEAYKAESHISVTAEESIFAFDVSEVVDAKVVSVYAW